MWILAAKICYDGVEKKKPNFMIPIIVLIPVGLVMQLIPLMISFTWFKSGIFIIDVLLAAYAWVCYIYWKQLRKSLTLAMNMTISRNIMNSMNVNHGRRFLNETRLTN